MIDYNKFIAKCEELGLYASFTVRPANCSFYVNGIDSDLTLNSGVMIYSHDEHFEQWIECLYNCKELK
jgi:hypothetical protein